MSMEKPLSKEEALLHQSYATEKEGVGFSEEASQESYAEAELLIKRLKEADFDWLEIDWDEVDFKDAVKMRELEQRLDTAVRSLVEKNRTNFSVSDFLKSTKKSMLPFVMSASLLLSPACGKRNETSETVKDAEKTATAILDGKPVTWTQFEQFRFLCSDKEVLGFLQESAKKKGITEENVIKLCSVENAEVTVKITK